METGEVWGDHVGRPSWQGIGLIPGVVRSIPATGRIALDNDVKNCTLDGGSSYLREQLCKSQILCKTVARISGDSETSSQDY